MQLTSSLRNIGGHSNIKESTRYFTEITTGMWSPAVVNHEIKCDYFKPKITLTPALGLKYLVKNYCESNPGAWSIYFVFVFRRKICLEVR